jgi:hypothetical protein
MQALEQIDIELLRKKSENWIIICPKIEKIYVFEGPVEPDAAEEMPNIFLCFQTSKKYARVTKTPDDEILNFLSEPFLDFNLKQISQNPEILWVKKVFWDYTEIEGYQPTQIFPRESAPVKENTPAAETVKSFQDFINQAKENKTHEGIIAVELKEKYNLTYLEIARALNLNANLQSGQIDAAKQRARRLIAKSIAARAKSVTP